MRNHLTITCTNPSIPLSKCSPIRKFNICLLISFFLFPWQEGGIKLEAVDGGVGVDAPSGSLFHLLFSLSPCREIHLRSSKRLCELEKDKWHWQSVWKVFSFCIWDRLGYSHPSQCSLESTSSPRGHENDCRFFAQMNSNGIMLYISVTSVINAVNEDHRESGTNWIWLSPLSSSSGAESLMMPANTASHLSIYTSPSTRLWGLILAPSSLGSFPLNLHVGVLSLKRKGVATFSRCVCVYRSGWSSSKHYIHIIPSASLDSLQRLPSLLLRLYD